MSTRSPRASFVIRLVGPEIRPWVVPLRVLARTLGAVQLLIEGEEADLDEEKTTQVRQGGVRESLLHLLDVKQGSAAYPVRAQNASLAVESLERLGEVLIDPESSDWPPTILSPLEDLSAVAKSLDCEIQFLRPYQKSGEDDVIARILPASHKQLADVAFVSGFTEVMARIERAGGATSKRCGIRLPDQSKMVFCSVESESLVRQLGTCLYKDALLYGKATWFKKSWQIRHLHIQSVTQLSGGSYLEGLSRLRDAGGSAWDEVVDLDAEIAKIRGQ